MALHTAVPDPNPGGSQEAVRPGQHARSLPLQFFALHNQGKSENRDNRLDMERRASSPDRCVLSALCG